MKFKTAFLACSLVCGSAMANSGLPNPAIHGQPVQINGTTFQKIVPKASAVNYSTRSSSQNGVYAGDELMDPAGIKSYTATGTLFVRIDDSEAQQYASKHGLNVILSARGITSFQAKEGTELTSLLRKLKEEGKQVQLELVNQKMQPM